MKRTPSKKDLRLDTTTVRELGRAPLTAVAGGASAPTYIRVTCGCPPVHE